MYPYLIELVSLLTWFQSWQGWVAREVSNKRVWGRWRVRKFDTGLPIVRKETNRDVSFVVLWRNNHLHVVRSPRLSGMTRAKWVRLVIYRWKRRLWISDARLREGWRI
jgi:hypothetical protein